jgi:hypothetical protein
MRASFFTFQDSVKQTTHFRGYIKIYQGQTVTIQSCSKVRTNQAEALRDAKKLIKSLSTIV